MTDRNAAAAAEAKATAALKQLIVLGEKIEQLRIEVRDRLAELEARIAMIRGGFR